MAAAADSCSTSRGSKASARVWMRQPTTVAAKRLKYALAQVTWVSGMSWAAEVTTVTSGREARVSHQLSAGSEPGRHSFPPRRSSVRPVGGPVNRLLATSATPSPATILTALRLRPETPRQPLLASIRAPAPRHPDPTGPPGGAARADHAAHVQLWPDGVPLGPHRQPAHLPDGGLDKANRPKPGVAGDPCQEHHRRRSHAPGDGRAGRRQGHRRRPGRWPNSGPDRG